MTGPIPKQYASDTCKLGRGAECCRYLGADKYGFCCLKWSEFYVMLNKRVEDKTINARGDNCVGWEKLEVN